MIRILEVWSGNGAGFQNPGHMTDVTERAAPSSLVNARTRSQGRLILRQQAEQNLFLNCNHKIGNRSMCNVIEITGRRDRRAA